MKICFENEEERQEFLEGIAESDLCPGLSDHETCAFDCRNCWAKALEEISEVESLEVDKDKRKNQEKQEVISCFDNEFAFLSNAYNSDILCQGLTYKNAESAYQAQKSSNIVMKRAFTDISANKAKAIGKLLVLPENWNPVVEMEAVVFKKFKQNKDLAELLIATNDAMIAPNGIGAFWGVENGNGENHLGVILMKIRETLKIEQDKTMENMVEEASAAVKNALRTNEDLLKASFVYYQLLDILLTEQERKFLTQRILSYGHEDAVLDIKIFLYNNPFRVELEDMKNFLLLCDDKTFIMLMNIIMEDQLELIPVVQEAIDAYFQ